MRSQGRWFAAALVTAGLALAGCTTDTSSGASAGGATAGNGPAKVESIAGKEVKKITLTEQAAKRLDIQTTVVAAAGTSMTVVPYAAVLYDPDGGTWVYTNPAPLTYVREKVVVAKIGGTDGSQAFLSQGPPVGTRVVVTGAIELYGAELGVGGEE
jgi:hypothetical protein